MHQKQVKIEVYGQVQGVGYRASCRKAALELGLVGTAQNRLDGSVLIHAQGEVEKVSKFIDWCQKGPPRAEVERIEVQEEENSTYNGFQITPS